MRNGRQRLKNREGGTSNVFKFFARRLLDLGRVIQQESEGETAKVERMEASENLIEEMASEERKVVEECRAEIGQKVRWADMMEEREGAERD